MSRLDDSAIWVHIRDHDYLTHAQISSFHNSLLSLPGVKMDFDNPLEDPEKNAFIRHCLMKFDKIRRGTFEAHVLWPSECPEPDLMVAAGFYSVGVGKAVECFSCGLRWDGWQSNDNPFSIHYQKNKNCPFVQGKDPSILNSQYPTILQVQSKDGLTHLHRPSRLMNQMAGVPAKSLTRAFSDKAYKSAIQSTIQARIIIPERRNPEDVNHPQIFDQKQWFKKMESERHRLKTFSLYAQWPLMGRHSAQRMASNGFFYLQFNDAVQCFCCQMIVQNLEATTFIEELHKQNSPLCPMVLEPESSSIPLSQDPVVRECTCGDEYREKVLCKICCERERNVVFDPCKHLGACDECAANLAIDPVVNMPKCPFCQGAIFSIDRIFLQ